MRRIVGLVLVFSVLVLASCAEQPRPQDPDPEIRIERSESSKSATLTVRYFYHRSDSANNCNARIVLDTPEKLQHYKAQTLFLLSQIEEAEKRMKVNEQDPK
jgi:hypothetical protein